MFFVAVFLLLLIFPLYLIFINLINIYLSMFLLGLSFMGLSAQTLCTSQTWMIFFFLSYVSKVFKMMSSNIFSGPFLLSSSSGALIVQMLRCLLLSQRSLGLFSFIFFSFFFFSVPQQRFPPLCLLGHLRRAWQPTTVFLPGEFHGQRSLGVHGGYSPWGCKKLVMGVSICSFYSCK